MDSGEKTEEPTAKKREEFREEGKVAVSRDVGGVAIAFGTLLVFVLQGPSLLETLRGHFARVGDAAAGAEDMDTIHLVMGAAKDAGLTAAALVATIAATAVVIAALAGFAQTGGNISTKALGFKLERLGLWSGLKRALASTEALQQVGLALAKAAVLGGALGAVLYLALPKLATLAHVGRDSALSFVGGLLLQLVVVALVASAVLAGVDLLLARRRIHEQMKMSKQEIKDEFKQAEGDPHVRNRLRQRMREIGRNQMIAATRAADVVVVNPTHYAVALKYAFGQVGAPKLVAKGTDAVAARIREVARKHQIPIIANPPVARAIHAAARVGQEVPPELYEVVAKVLAYLYRIGNRGAAA